MHSTLKWSVVLGQRTVHNHLAAADDFDERRLLSDVAALAQDVVDGLNTRLST